MLARRVSVVVLCVGLALLLGCRRQNESLSYLTITYEVSPQPPRVGQTSITVDLTDVSGKPLTGAEVTLEGNMSHAGMLPVTAAATEVSPGRYRAIMELSMAGDWNITAHVKSANGLNLERQFDIKGVANH